MAANTDVEVVVAKITNPSSVAININWVLQGTTMSVASKEETPLYQSTFTMFINMLSPSISSSAEADSTTAMFQPGSGVGDSGRYFNAIPLTNSGTFSEEDWYVVEMSSDFPLASTSSVAGCQFPYYLRCLVFPEVNWLAVQIGNTTLLPLYPTISLLPKSISRSDTTYQAYTFKSSRWAETITYTITALNRWMEIRGQVSNFGLEVLGSQDKLNIGQRAVEVKISFTVQHTVEEGGSI